MSDGSHIQWTDATWNPLRGCTRVSDGCRNCYAERLAARFSGDGQPYEGLARFDSRHRPRWTGKIRLLSEKLDQPLRWQAPRRIFVNSMSDLFHPRVPDRFIEDVFAVMVGAPRHQFQVLTKRPERMADLTSSEEFWGCVWSRGMERWWDEEVMAMLSKIGPDAPLRKMHAEAIRAER